MLYSQFFTGLNVTQVGCKNSVEMLKISIIPSSRAIFVLMNFNLRWIVGSPDVKSSTQYIRSKLEKFGSGLGLWNISPTPCQREIF